MCCDWFLLKCERNGTIHLESNVCWCPDVRHNMISEGRVHNCGLHHLSIASLKTWHNRLVHIYYERLVNMDRKKLVQRMKLRREARQKKHIEAAAQPCPACRLSKPRRRKFKMDNSVYTDAKDRGI